MKLLKAFWNFISRVGFSILGKAKRQSTSAYYQAQYVKDFPDNREAMRVYLLGRPSSEWLAGMDCPCGCKSLIELVLTGEKHPKWQIVVGKDGKVTLKPSVWRTIGCKSHFYLVNGTVHWCKQ